MAVLSSTIIFVTCNIVQLALIPKRHDSDNGLFLAIYGIRHSGNLSIPECRSQLSGIPPVYKVPHNPSIMIQLLIWTYCFTFIHQDVRHNVITLMLSQNGS